MSEQTQTSESLPNPLEHAIIGLTTDTDAVFAAHGIPPLAESEHYRRLSVPGLNLSETRFAADDVQVTVWNAIYVHGKGAYETKFGEWRKGGSEVDTYTEIIPSGESIEGKLDINGIAKLRSRIADAFPAPEVAPKQGKVARMLGRNAGKDVRPR